MARGFQRQQFLFFFLLNIKLEASRWLWQSRDRSGGAEKALGGGCPYVPFQFAVTHLKGFWGTGAARRPLTSPLAPSLIPNEARPLLLGLTLSHGGTFLPRGECERASERYACARPVLGERPGREGGGGDGDTDRGEVKSDGGRGQLPHSYHDGQKNERDEGEIKSEGGTVTERGRRQSS